MARAPSLVVRDARETVDDIKVALKIRGPMPTGLLTLLPKRFYRILPNDRVEGAYLPRETWTHWFFAVVAGGTFMALGLLLLPAKSTKPAHVFLTGLFTGTCGVLLLLLVQMMASSMRGRIIIPRAPMVLHGLYDTLLKKDMPGYALVVAAISFAWLVYQVERARRQDERAPVRAAYA